MTENKPIESVAEYLEQIKKYKLNKCYSRSESKDYGETTLLSSKQRTITNDPRKYFVDEHIDEFYHKICTDSSNVFIYNKNIARLTALN